jgi:hypothetical protein
VESSRSQQSLLECIDSFLVPQMSDRLIQIAEAHAETLGWIYDEPGPGIAPWLRSGSGVFWIQGKPGSGKSTAMKFMLHDRRTLTLLNTGAREVKFDVIGCFFTDRADRVQASWSGILHSMVYQLLSQNHAAAHFVLPFWKEATRRRTQGEPLWGADTMERILLVLKSEINQPLNVCFLIDAIDEHDGNHTRMCKFLHELCGHPSATAVFKVCAASRPENELRDLFKSDLTISIHDWTRGDIQRFVSQELSLHPRWETLLVGEGIDIAARIENDIGSRAQGVFLWVRLIIDELLEGLTNGYSLLELELQTNEVPDDLKGFFAHIIKKINKKYHLELLIIIETLLRCRGALNAAFLKLVIRANLRKPNENAVLPSVASEEKFDAEGFSRRLQSRCGGLIEMVVAATATNTYNVQFLHQTVKEYFLENENLSSISQSLRVESPTMGITFSNGHFFLLNGFLEWLRLPEAARRLPKLKIEGITRDIIYHTLAIERELGTSPVRLLGELGDTITQQNANGDLWPFEACGMCSIRDEVPTRITEAMKAYMKRERLPPQHSLLMLAITLGWKHYVQQKTSSDATSSIKSVGVCQFAYLCCPAMTEEATSLLESAEFLVNSGVGITKCQEIGDGCHADALGFFVSSHLRCPLSTKSDRADRVYQIDHHKVFRLLLELGANPWGKCLNGWSSSEEYSGVVTIAEALISRSGLMANLELIELLARYCPNTRPLAAELFDTSPDKVFESVSLMGNFDEDTFIWLCSNGAYISESLASRIYRPLIEGLKHQSNGTRTYSEALKSLSEQGMPDPALILDRSLMNLYQYELDGYICKRDKFLLKPAQRRPIHYDAAARRFAAKFNPHWSVEEVPAESTSTIFRGFLRSRYWQNLFPHETT